MGSNPIVSTTLTSSFAVLVILVRAPRRVRSNIDRTSIGVRGPRLRCSSGALSSWGPTLSRFVRWLRQPGECVCYRTVPVWTSVLVDESGSGARMTHSDHELFGAGTRGRRERVAGMAKIMESKSDQPDGCTGWLPHPPVEVAAPQRGTVRGREQKCLRCEVSTDGEVSFEFG